MPDAMRPPVNRAMRVLDRTYFKKSVPLAAARVFKNQHISQCRHELEKSKDMLRLERGATSIRPDPVAEFADAGKKCVLLQEHVKPDGIAFRCRNSGLTCVDSCRQTPRPGAPQYSPWSRMNEYPLYRTRFTSTTTIGTTTTSCLQSFLLTSRTKFPADLV